ncbi:conserved hypothetical protein [Desulfamplus magnetovallimortis]|uniref:Uncharacterized protein n=1 Tax=Desulfamplus magnetovallimortis TaxID=1246637 RepID=A0A1W1H6A2_9BACT|nr:hypothetical protein [Desulfamplus magnetovallimortis]SLM27982.1 conserved hypothetical protein [Desulfamplus magnetovallimortis]
METELLVIKSADKYLRVKDSQYHLCGLDKASVFPMNQLDKVKEHVKYASREQNMEPEVFKLVLREEPI